MGSKCCFSNGKTSAFSKIYLVPRWKKRFCIQKTHFCQREIKCIFIFCRGSPLKKCALFQRGFQVVTNQNMIFANQNMICNQPEYDFYQPEYDLTYQNMLFCQPEYDFAPTRIWLLPTRIWFLPSRIWFHSDTGSGRNLVCRCKIHLSSMYGDTKQPKAHFSQRESKYIFIFCRGSPFKKSDFCASQTRFSQRGNKCIFKNALGCPLKKTCFLHQCMDTPNGKKRSISL